MRLSSAVVMAVALAAVPPSPAAAQGATPSFRPWRVTISGGIAAAGGHDLGDMTGELRRNTVGAPASFPLLRAESELGRAIGVDGRASVAVTPALAVEVGTTYSKPRLTVRVSDDPEAPGQTTIDGRFEQYTIDVSALYLLRALALGASVRPYVLAGAGYLRQLDESRLHADTGRAIHIGAGLQYWLRGGGAQQRPVGLRAEARLVRRTGGSDFETEARVFTGGAVLGFIGF